MPPLDLSTGQEIFAGLVCGAVILMVPVLLLALFTKDPVIHSDTPWHMFGLYK